MLFQPSFFTFIKDDNVTPKMTTDVIYNSISNFEPIPKGNKKEQKIDPNTKTYLA